MGTVSAIWTDSDHPPLEVFSQRTSLIGRAKQWIAGCGWVPRRRASRLVTAGGTGVVDHGRPLLNRLTALLTHVAGALIPQRGTRVGRLVCLCFLRPPQSLVPNQAY